MEKLENFLKQKKLRKLRRILILIKKILDLKKILG